MHTHYPTSSEIAPKVRADLPSRVISQRAGGKGWGAPLVMGLSGCLFLLGWLIFPGCIGVGPTCDDKVCIVTAYKQCAKDQDCCCSQRCNQGCCLPGGADPIGIVACGTPPPDGGNPDTPLAECINGQKRLCFPGRDVAGLLGLCKAGEQSCEGGEWGACVDYVLPEPEACDGKDNDCDGAIDEGADCGCKPNDTRACGQGVCAGTQSCGAGKIWGVCVPTAPQKETCDGKDNDCNGLIDDGAGCDEIVASATDKKAFVAQIWDWKAPRALRLLGLDGEHKGAILALAFRPAGDLLATVSADQDVRIWNPDDGTLIKALKGHKSEILSVSFGPKGSFLLTGDAAGTVILWDVAAGRPVHTIEKVHQSAVRSVAFIEGGALLASAGDDGFVVVSNAATGIKLFGLEPTPGEAIKQMAISADGALFAVIIGATLQVWEWKTQKVRKTYDAGAALVGVAFSPVAAQVLVTTTRTGIQRWDVAESKAAPVDDWKLDWATLEQPQGLAIHQDGVTLGLIGVPTSGKRTDRYVYLFDLQKPDLGLRLRDGFGSVDALAFRPAP